MDAVKRFVEKARDSLSRSKERVVDACCGKRRRHLQPSDVMMSMSPRESS